jgi:teichuronic acid biosynthesis glycosyltransferase TuaG
MPRVSVIIPAFNAEPHIEEALRSVQNQTYNDWEIVLCDDGSTDRTVERARSVGCGVAVVQSTNNLGPAAARNLAIEHCSGELLVFLDADDYWLPSYLERQVSQYDEGQAQYGNVGIVACNASLLEPDGMRAETHMEAVRFPSEVTLDRLLRYNPIYISALAPRRAVEEVGGFCADLSGTADYDLWIRIVEAGYKVLATREPLAVYRIGSPSLSSDARAMARDMQQTYRRALERGNLPPRERRIARRELRRQDLVERIASADGLSYRQALRALPLLLLVIAEHPRAWPSLPRMIARGRSTLGPFPR